MALEFSFTWAKRPSISLRSSVESSVRRRVVAELICPWSSKRRSRTSVAASAGAEDSRSTTAASPAPADVGTCPAACFSGDWNPKIRATKPVVVSGLAGSDALAAATTCCSRTSKRMPKPTVASACRAAMAEVSQQRASTSSIRTEMGRPALVASDGNPAATVVAERPNGEGEPEGAGGVFSWKLTTSRALTGGVTLVREVPVPLAMTSASCCSSASKRARRALASEAGELSIFLWPSVASLQASPSIAAGIATGAAAPPPSSAPSHALCCTGTCPSCKPMVLRRRASAAQRSSRSASTRQARARTSSSMRRNRRSSRSSASPRTC
mmetsp:Transcript_102048/g.218513  ORF Transcript_102048/g.218513 Transcript_102048/m.218513 type:complete len:326 (-) Transcript_102048:269-1246(-)